MIDTDLKTSDTGLATYLITQGFSLLSIDYSQPRYEYHFTKTLEANEHADKYLTGRATTNPASFLRVNKKLLRIIYKRIQWEED